MSADVGGDPGRAFTRIANGYDDSFTNTGLGTALRGRVWDVLDATFVPGDRVIDLGCGTGEDARHMADRGMWVTALDASPAMAATARAKTHALRAGRVDVFAARMEDGLDMFADGSFDGVVSSFGAINCVADLRALAASLARLTRPGGHLVLTVMGPLCAWEILWNLLTLKPRVALRRLSPGGTSARVGGRPIHVHYPSGFALGRQLARGGFRRVSLEGVGLVLPPTQASAFLDRHAVTLRAAARADRVLGRVPVAAALSDHYLAVYRKMPARG